MGGGEIHARVNAKKKNSSKEEGKEKNFMQKESPSVTSKKYWLVSIKVVLIQKNLGALPQAHYY